jgi:hypothetical protein
MKTVVDDDREVFGQAVWVKYLLPQSAAWLGQQRFSRHDEAIPQADAVSWELLADEGNGHNP